MHWLSQNYQWLFDGFLGALVIAVGGFFIQRSLEKARDGGDSQTEPVNESRQPEQKEPKPPNANVRITGGRTVKVHRGLNGAFLESLEGRDDGSALVVNITNDAQQGMPNVGAMVKATLVYRENGKAELRVTGTWLAQHADRVQLRVDDSHSVILALALPARPRIGVRFQPSVSKSVPSKRRVVRSFGRAAFPTDHNPIHSNSVEVTVRLTNADTGDFFCEEKYRIEFDPPRIVEHL